MGERERERDRQMTDKFMDVYRNRVKGYGEANNRTDILLLIIHGQSYHYQPISILY